MTDIDEITSALVADCRSAAVPGLDVSDGQAYDPDGDFLAVAWAGEDSPGIEFSIEPVDYGQASSMTTLDVTCLLTLHQGKWTDAAAIRSALIAAFRVFADAIRAGSALNPLLMRPAQIDTGQVQIAGDEGGIEGRLAFNVHCVAQTTP